ncbi:MAG: FISUMP domain-containing protein [Bacteroidota bacterium]
MEKLPEPGSRNPLLFILGIVLMLNVPLPAMAIESDFLLTIRNVYQVAPNVLEFDVYLEDTDPNQPFQLSAIQLGIYFNLGMLNGAPTSTSMTSIISGYSQLPANMQPISITTTSAGLIRIAARNFPGPGNGYIVATTSPGTLITHLRITNSVAFTTGSTPDMSFTSSSAVNPSYATRIGIYAGGTTNTFLTVTPNVNAIVPENPVLSVPTIINSVAGYLYAYYFQMDTPPTTYQITASNLTDDLIIDVTTTNANPDECSLEISLTPDNGYSTQLVITPVNGFVNTTIYVKPDCTVVPFSTYGTITHSSTGASPDIMEIWIENEYSYYYAPVVTIGQVYAVPGISAYVPINATGFEHFGVAEYFIDYDPTILSFTGIENVHLNLPYHSVCLNCEYPYLCCYDFTNYLRANVINIDPSHNRLYIEIYHEVGQFSVPDGDKLFDMVFNYSGGYADLVFTDGNYIYSGNGAPWDPVIINEPFGDYYFNGSVEPVQDPPVITNSVNGEISEVFYQMYTPTVSYQVTATDLTGDLTIEASTTGAYPVDCQVKVSLFPDQGFSSQLTLSPENGSVNATIYVKPGCNTVPFWCDGIITQTSTGATPDIIDVYLENYYSYRYAPVATIADVYSGPENEVVVPITVTNFTDAGVGEYYIEYNPTVLTFTGLQNAHPNLEVTICNNCTEPYECCSDPFIYFLSNTTNIDPTHSILYLKFYHESNYLGRYSIPDDEILVELLLEYSGGFSELTFTEGGYLFSGNMAPVDPHFIDEPFENYYFNGSVGPFPKSMNLTLNLEGLFNPATGEMNQAQGNAFQGEVADEITVGIAQSTFPYTVIFEKSSVLLYQNGTCQLDIPGIYNGEYYLVVSHRNSIETWSAHPVSFTGSSVTYDFSTAVNAAYGNNQKLSGTKYCLFGGDVNQDGTVDTGDISPLDNDAAVFTEGYVATDVNGDGIVDTGDMTFVDNNAAVFIGAIFPVNNTVNDVDGNIYQTVNIGSQTWMAENLRTTRFANGEVIPNITDNTQWSVLTTGAWCWYGNDDQYENPYGKLYSWYTVVDSRNLCPEGWQVPTDAEWTTLTDYLGGLNAAGNKLKEAGFEHWVYDPNSNATNQSGFTGLPGGYRYIDGSYLYLGLRSYWWSATDAGANPETAWGRSLGYNYMAATRGNYYKKDGISVRCLKN